MKRILLLTLAGIFLAGTTFAQDDLLNDLKAEDSAQVKENITAATFKATRIINMHSVEMTGVGNLQFLVIHHFGEIWNSNEGGSNFGRLLGINGSTASTYISFDYAPIRWLDLGVGFAGFSTVEGFAKFKILRQQTGKKNIPVSMVWISTAHWNTSESAGSPNDLYWNRFSFLHQLLVARKFNEKFSLQLSGNMVHNNIAPYGLTGNEHNIYSAGIGGRYKFTEKTALTFEYSRQFNMYEDVMKPGGDFANYSPDLISIGYDWDTGGHIFQFFITNSRFASNIPQLSTNPELDDIGQFSLGFNLNRSYSVKKNVKVQN
jgi:Membrane bound beta barrel domain (DUF5777)